MTVSSRHMARLAIALSNRRNGILDLWRQLTGLGARGSLSPSAFEKFTGLLDQIAVERQEEEQLLNRIVAVEAQHNYRRVHRQLEPAPALAAFTTGQNDQPAQPVSPKNRLFWLLVILYWLRLRLK